MIIALKLLTSSKFGVTNEPCAFDAESLKWWLLCRRLQLFLSYGCEKYKASKGFGM